jgi:hypothetical protein
MKVTVKSLFETCTARQLFESLDATLKATSTITDGLAVQELDTWLKGFVKAVGLKENEIMKGAGASPTPSGGWEIRPAEASSPEGEAAAAADVQARAEKSQEAIKVVHDEEVEVPGDYPITISISDEKYLELIKINANRHLAPFITMARKK